MAAAYGFRRPASELRLADVLEFRRSELPASVQEAIAAISRERLAAVVAGLRLAA